MGENILTKITYTQVHHSWETECLLNSKFLVRTGGKDSITPFLLPSNETAPLSWAVSS